MSGFIWNDLSTYDLRAAKRDYHRLFDWHMDADQTYALCQIRGVDVAALYPMPGPLRARNMPSFWMSYIHVPNVGEVVEQAESFANVKIEVPPTDFMGAVKLP